MLRVGLTGELGSGKSTVARLFAALGAHVLSSDETGRALMQPGQPVFQAIVEHFGHGVLLPDGTLDRPALAALAFDPRHPRVEELNQLVHPAVIAAQEQQVADFARTDPHGITLIESALLLTTRHAGSPDPWHSRFDQIILVTAPDALKLQRAVARSAGERMLSSTEMLALQIDAERRLAAQRIPPELARRCLRISNDGDLGALEACVRQLWQQLQSMAQPSPASSS